MARTPSSIPGVIARSSEGESKFVSLTPLRIQKMDDLPFPDYQDFFRDYAQLPDGSRLAGIPMETSRGCWWGEKNHCTFCGLNANSMTFVSKSPTRALAEINHLHEAYRVRDIQMVDNILDMKCLRTLLPRLAERGSQSRSGVGLERGGLAPSETELVSGARTDPRIISEPPPLEPGKT